MRSDRRCPNFWAVPRTSRPSNGTWRKDSVTLTPAAPGGNYVHFGVREFGMSAMLNGIAAHGGFIPYGGTFLTFSDYARNALRMAALMRLRVIFVYTHDSIGLGEDGPTHQPIEHLASLRAHSAHGSVAALRWGRDRGRLGCRHRQPRWADVPDLHAPVGRASGARPDSGRGNQARRLCA